MKKNKFLVPLVSFNLLCCQLIQATFQEFFFNATLPSKAACACLKKKSKCNLELLCEKFFVSHRPSEFVLFLKKGFLKTENLGHVRYSYTRNDSGDTAFIGHVWLDEDWRSKGLGYMLMQHTLMEMSNAKINHVTLAVHQSNLPAIALYNKCGFLKHKRVDGGYIMLRTLSDEIKNS